MFPLDHDEFLYESCEISLILSLCVFLHLLDSCDIMMWLLFESLLMCCYVHVKRLLVRSEANIMQVGILEVIEEMKSLCMKKWQMLRTNRLFLDENRLYQLSVLQKRKF